MTDQEIFVVRSTEALGDVRSWVRASARASLERDRIDDLALVTSELATNALEHGSGGPVKVTLETTTTHVDLTVSSPSHGEPEPAPEEAAPVDAVRGRGLFIVASLSDEVTIGGERGEVSITSRFVR